MFDFASSLAMSLQLKLASLAFKNLREVDLWQVYNTCTYFQDLRNVWPCVIRFKIHKLINIFLISNRKNKNTQFSCWL